MTNNIFEQTTALPMNVTYTVDNSLESFTVPIVSITAITLEGINILQEFNESALDATYLNRMEKVLDTVYAAVEKYLTATHQI
jgi:hypothetical protein